MRRRSGNLILAVGSAARQRPSVAVDLDRPVQREGYCSDERGDRRSSRAVVLDRLIVNRDDLAWTLSHVYDRPVAAASTLLEEAVACVRRRGIT